MKYIKQNKIFGTLFAISSVLMATACFTITNTYSYPDSAPQVKKWSVALKDVKTNMENNKVNIVNDKMDLSVTLNKAGEVMTVNSSITNDGNFDAILNNVEMTDLSNIKIGTSEETNKTYYLSDYVVISLRYAKDNKTNLIDAGSNVLAGDKLAKFTKNEIVASIKYKELNGLSEDALVVLKQNMTDFDGNVPLKFSLSIGFNYIENTK